MRPVCPRAPPHVWGRTGRSSESSYGRTRRAYRRAYRRVPPETGSPGIGAPPRAPRALGPVEGRLRASGGVLRVSGFEAQPVPLRNRLLGRPGGAQLQLAHVLRRARKSLIYGKLQSRERIAPLESST
jgi:hypothetical protein